MKAMLKVCAEPTRNNVKKIDKDMIILLKSKRITGLLSAIVFCLLLAHVAGQISVFYLGSESNVSLVKAFDLDSEGNIPTFFSTVALMTCSLLFAVIACAKRADGDPYALHWTGLAMIFLYLSGDEALALHEKLIRPIRSTFGLSGLLYYSWVIPYAVFLAILSRVYLSFLLHLTRKARCSFLIAGAIYVLGAMGLEMVAGVHVGLYGKNNLTFILLTTLEELFEMIGVVVLIGALISYIVDAGQGEVRIKITS